jgi:hypothetical protein
MEQYIRDMVVFGVNQIEIVGPDGGSSPHFLLPPVIPFLPPYSSEIDMMIEISKIVHAYALNFSIWLPPEESSDGWESLFQKIPYLDSLFVPSGDPGSMEPLDLFNYVENKVPILRKYHSEAQVWMSQQTFNASQVKQR